MASENVVILTDSTFDQLIEKTDKLVFVDFWASWCGPCRALAPIFDSLADAEAYRDKIIFAKVNIDECTEVAQKLRIMSIPTLILFKDGVFAEKLIGLRQESDLKALLDKYIAEPETEEGAE